MLQYVQAHVARDRPGIPITGPVGLCLHWTGNLSVGSGAMANRNWCQNGARDYAMSVHYFVNSLFIVECVPPTEVAYHCGSSRPTPLALQKFGGKQNLYLLGVEWCVPADGDGALTYRNVVGLCGYLHARYGWAPDSILRHSDLTTTKLCPAFFVSDYWANRMGFGPSANEAYVKFLRDVRVAAASANVVREVQRVVGW